MQMRTSTLHQKEMFTSTDEFKELAVKKHKQLHYAFPSPIAKLFRLMMCVRIYAANPDITSTVQYIRSESAESRAQRVSPRAGEIVLSSLYSVQGDVVENIRLKRHRTHREPILAEEYLERGFE